MVLGAILRFAQRRELITTNPIDGVERHPVRYSGDYDIYSREEIDAIARSATDDQDAAIILTAALTGLRRGELLALRWKDIRLLEHQLDVREAIVKGRFTTPKSSASRRLIELGPKTQQLLSQHWQQTAFQGDQELVFCHPQKGTPLDPSKLARCYLRPALKHAGIEKPFRPFHDLRHTALTHEAAAGNPMAHIQQKAGHSQSSITERYIHAAQTSFPGAAARSEERILAAMPTTEPVR
jgi:integrase